MQGSCLMRATHFWILGQGEQSKSSTSNIVISWKAIKSAIFGFSSPRNFCSRKQIFSKLRKDAFTTLQVNSALKVGSPNLRMGAKRRWKDRQEHLRVFVWWKSKNQLSFACRTRSLRGYHCSERLNLRQRYRRMVWLSARSMPLSVSWMAGTFRMGLILANFSLLTSPLIMLTSTTSCGMLLARQSAQTAREGCETQSMQSLITIFIKYLQYNDHYRINLKDSFLVFNEI